MDSLRIGYYYVTFFSRHLADKKICDDVSGWWSKWNEYYLRDTNIPVYGTRVFFGQKRKPDLTKYMLWTDTVHLTDPSCFIHESISIDSQSNIISANQCIDLRH